MKRKVFSILFAVVLVLSLSLMTTVPVAAQTTWYVDDATCPSTGSGTSGDPFCSIQDAIDAASAGDTINVAAGTYYENITLKNGVEVLGAGASVTTIQGTGAGSVVTAISVSSSTKLDGFTITGGNAINGGGMYNWSSSLVVTNCTFSANLAAAYGGGMCNSWYSSPTVTNCTFSANSAMHGGGMNNDYSSPTVTNCTFSGNSATWYGGGMRNYYSSPTVTNCTFSGNWATYGGGMFNYSYSPVVTNCTFFGNSATYGDGMYNWESSPVVTNCILWGDSPDEIYDSGSTPVVTYCDVQGGYSGVGNIDADPLFVNPAADDYHLQSGSPCIDTGSNAAPSLPTTDFEGDPRIVDGNGDGSAVADMGVDEYVPPPPPIVGGTVYPVDKVGILMPWIGLAVALALAGVFVTRLARRKVRG